MSGSGGFAVSRSHSGDRFYNPPAIRRHQQLLLQQQHLQRQQLRRPGKLDPAPPPPPAAAAVVLEAENRADSDDSTTTLSKPPPVCSTSPPTSTNLDRLMESVTPLVPAQHFTEMNAGELRNHEVESNPYYCIGDLWECFREWSVYGVGVPLLLNGEDSIIQYYVPFLSGIQLYADPLKQDSKIRRPGEEADAESTNSGGSSDCEVNQNSQRLHRLVLRDKSVINPIDEAETSNSPGVLFFEYLEHEQPYNRRPLTDKVSFLESKFSELKMYKSCDLLPSSWMSVAWYPIYRIPVGPTLRDLDASFLTFHTLSTKSKSNDLKVHDGSSKIRLPVFGLASYKLKGSLLSPSGASECEQENSLLQAADNWLNRLQVVLPDYQFFRSHYSQWKR